MAGYRAVLPFFRAPPPVCCWPEGIMLCCCSLSSAALLPSNDDYDAAAADRAQELAKAHTTPQADFVKTQQPEQQCTPEPTADGADDDNDNEELGEPELVLELSDEWKEHFR
eukprot:17382-Heterococcus_DN1.PRE.3